MSGKTDDATAIRRDAAIDNDRTAPKVHFAAFRRAPSARFDRPAGI